jgi:hypothetical protein
MIAVGARTLSGVAAVVVRLVAGPVPLAQPPSPPPLVEGGAGVTLPAGDLPGEAPAIRKILEVYVRAVAEKDLSLFRTVKPNLSNEEEQRARTAFKSVQSQVVRMNVVSVDVRDGIATVRVTRRDTLNGSIVSSFPQTFQLTKAATGWTIQDIGR